MSGSGYDDSVIFLSPEGKIYQIEYAEKAVEGSSTIVGVVCKDGVVLGTEKVLPSKLLVPQTDKRVYSISRYSGIVVNGVIPDGRNIMYKGRKEYKSYYDQYGTEISGKVLAERLGQYMHFNTCYYSKRPYGTSCAVASYDKIHGYTLHMMDPSGTCDQYYGCANGRGKQTARSEIEKVDFRSLTCEEALPKIAKILLMSTEETKDKSRELEFSVVSDETNHEHKQLSAARCEELLQSALKAIDEEDMDED